MVTELVVLGELGGALRWATPLVIVVGGRRRRDAGPAAAGPRPRGTWSWWRWRRCSPRRPPGRPRRSVTPPTARSRPAGRRRVGGRAGPEAAAAALDRAVPGPARAGCGGGFRRRAVRSAAGSAPPAAAARRRGRSGGRRRGGFGGDSASLTAAIAYAKAHGGGTIGVVQPEQRRGGDPVLGRQRRRARRLLRPGELGDRHVGGPGGAARAATLGDSRWQLVAPALRRHPDGQPGRDQCRRENLQGGYREAAPEQTRRCTTAGVAPAAILAAAQELALGCSSLQRGTTETSLVRFWLSTAVAWSPPCCVAPAALADTQRQLPTGPATPSTTRGSRSARCRPRGSSRPPRARPDGRPTRRSGWGSAASSPNSAALEQIGTEADCNAGRQSGAERLVRARAGAVDADSAHGAAGRHDQRRRHRGRASRDADAQQRHPPPWLLEDPDRLGDRRLIGGMDRRGAIGVPQRSAPARRFRWPTSAMPSSPPPRRRAARGTSVRSRPRRGRTPSWCSRRVVGGTSPTPATTRPVARPCHRG